MQRHMPAARTFIIATFAGLLATCALPSFDSTGKTCDPSGPRCTSGFECTRTARNPQWTCRPPCAQQPTQGQCYLAADGKPVYSYYVAVNTGDDANAGTYDAPLKTIRAGMERLKPGDILIIRGGKYVENLDSNEFQFPSGVSWDEPVVITGVPGDEPLIAPSTGCEAFKFAQPNLQFVSLENLVVDGSNLCLGGRAIHFGPGVKDMRVLRTEVYGALGSGIGMSAGTTRIEVRECKLHGNANDPACSATNGGPCTGQIGIGGFENRVEGCEVFNARGYGILVYASGMVNLDNNTIVGNRIYETGQIAKSTPGIAITKGRGNLVMNNILFSNAQGIHINYGTVDSKIFNNTVYNTQFAGIALYDSDGGQVLNNIVFRNATNVLNNASNSRIDKNLTEEPSFVDAARNDFRLKAGSAAIDTGTPLAPVTSDFNGVPRPQGAGYDIGAYEYVAP